MSNSLGPPGCLNRSTPDLEQTMYKGSLHQAVILHADQPVPVLQQHLGREDSQFRLRSFMGQDPKTLAAFAYACYRTDKELKTM